MPKIESVQPRRLGISALVLSVVALLVPAVTASMIPELGDYQLLLWLLCIVPAFLLAYYRGWRGAALALALGMVVLIGTHVVLLWIGRPAPRLPGMVAVVGIYVTIALGAGWLAERLMRDHALTEQMAFTDVLTGLANRRHALMVLEREFAAAQRERPLVIAVFDVDRFKEYNDLHGHAAGDMALQAAAATIEVHTRRMNLSARLGGDEFLSILADSDEAGAVRFVERVRAALRNSDAGPGKITLSCGIAGYSPAMQGPEELLAAADQALYEAKRAGRDCARVHRFANVTPPAPSGGTG